MKATMGKALRVFLTFLLAVLPVGGLSLADPDRVKAETEQGDSCWGFSLFTDVIRVTVVSADLAPDTFNALHGRWKSNAGLAAYQFEVSGHMSQDLTSPGGTNLAFGISGSQGTASFGNDQNCSISASLDPVTLNGSYRVACSPGPGAAPFTATAGTMVSIACPDGASPQRPGSAIGEAINETKSQ